MFFINKKYLGWQRDKGESKRGGGGDRGGAVTNEDECRGKMSGKDKRKGDARVTI